MWCLTTLKERERGGEREREGEGTERERGGGGERERGRGGERESERERVRERMRGGERERDRERERERDRERESIYLYSHVIKNVLTNIVSRQLRGKPINTIASTQDHTHKLICTNIIYTQGQYLLAAITSNKLK